MARKKRPDWDPQEAAALQPLLAQVQTSEQLDETASAGSLSGVLDRLPPKVPANRMLLPFDIGAPYRRRGGSQV